MKILFVDKITPGVFCTTAKNLVLNRLLDSCNIFVEEYMKLRNVSIWFLNCDNKRLKRLWKRFVQTEYNSCKKFCKKPTTLAKFLQDPNISCESLSMLMQSLARSCKSFCNNFLKEFIFSQLGWLSSEQRWKRNFSKLRMLIFDKFKTAVFG